MADRRSSGNRRQSSRLQGRAPASIQVNRVTDWNVAIPLLSPLVQSPTSPRSHILTGAETSSSEKKEKLQSGTSGSTATTSFKKWQHPAAPFYYEPAPLVPFVSTAPARFGVDRR
ncbi:OLC1v1019778C1 [Oldenlandia corymbosa var. corymbosa]|uniref:OLC1v1019778C1 n=1 Tax=Oldenlandia corymbosa var. corymbosa TaxID=529605 RepID=A0AAV1EEX7_OLDCO|nr:OLC1v1019778C1 [Oldenlandia corymbosa var. corymbosa]